MMVKWVLLIWMLLMCLLATFAVKSYAHGVHFVDVRNSLQPVVAQGWIEGVGYCFATDKDGDGLPDIFWLLYKAGGIEHHQGVTLHIKPLTKETARKLLRGGNPNDR